MKPVSAVRGGRRTGRTPRARRKEKKRKNRQQRNSTTQTKGTVRVQVVLRRARKPHSQTTADKRTSIQQRQRQQQSSPTNAAPANNNLRYSATALYTLPPCQPTKSTRRPSLHSLFPDPLPLRYRSTGARSLVIRQQRTRRRRRRRRVRSSSLSSSVAVGWRHHYSPSGYAAIVKRQLNVVRRQHRCLCSIVVRRSSFVCRRSFVVVRSFCRG